ncbi:hypothetical protein LZ198_13680 [Myxococcus sp. K15C18031901]|uniref:hypothetical protein n=1 Tax=Myxococcus dinghuensis TaxID=2906761 RepID=UPI0020A6E8E3|nr:hypothetical protein [Myxococcus dinghuensis]MCP3099921.1 hypothetical protein [Myxococcus dinghuensis]
MSTCPRLALLCASLLSTACATSSETERPRGPPPKALFQSPLALLLEHRGELTLTADQVTRLESMERALEEKNAPLREKMREARAARPEQSGRGPPPGGGGMGGGGPRGMGGGGGGGRGMMGGGGPPRRGGGGPRSEETTREQKALLREMEDQETAAYMEAEKLLDDTQRSRARELFSQQREERLRWRESAQG